MKMKKIMILSLTFLALGTVTYGQDLEQAKKAIDGEQYEKAKTILKSLVASKADEGKNYFFLGNVYLTLNQADSANAVFQKGIAVKNNANFNYIGLGQLDLDKDNKTGAQTNFATATKDLRKKDFEEYLYVGRAYMNSKKPDYKNALVSLNKAKSVQPQDAQVLLALGDAYYGDNNNNEAYSNYRSALTADSSILRAKIQMGVITKRAKAFPEAVKAFEDVLATNPNYGPAYRELAETYYFWANNAKDEASYNANIKKALGYYEKYMTLTDYSLDSRMRHADFLILTKEYKALEDEANKMKQIDNVNPRILRYLGYAAYENNNADGSVKALQDFITKSPADRVIGRDYLYLGLAKLKQAVKDSDTIVSNKEIFASAIADMKKGVEVDPAMSEEISPIALKLFKQKLYGPAAEMYQVAVLNTKSQNFLYDNFYLGYALYFEYASQDKPEEALLHKADIAFGNVITASPTTQDAHLYRARVNRLLEAEAAQLLMVTHYEEYIKLVTEKGEAETSKAAIKANLVEAYSTIGAFYVSKDKAKAIQNFEKALLINPADEASVKAIKSLRK